MILVKNVNYADNFTLFVKQCVEGGLYVGDCHGRERPRNNSKETARFQ